MIQRADGLEDFELVERIKSGERDLFRILIQRHQRAVHALGMSFFRNSDDAADYVQEVFLKVFRSLASFEGRARFSTWLYRIAYNTAINATQRRKEYLSLAENMELLDTESPEIQALRSSSQTAIRKAVEELPERYRVCVDLFFFYGLSYPEIEVITGIPVNTIKSHVFRAKTTLRETLRGEAEGGIE